MKYLLLILLIAGTGCKDHMTETVEFKRYCFKGVVSANGEIVDIEHCYFNTCEEMLRYFDAMRKGNSGFFVTDIYTKKYKKLVHPEVEVRGE